MGEERPIRPELLAIAAAASSALLLIDLSLPLGVAGGVPYPEGGIPWVVLTNRFLALFAIWVTAVLLARAKTAEMGLQSACDDLEQRVQERTEKLVAANQELESEISDRKRTQAALRRSHEVLERIRENHSRILREDDPNKAFDAILTHVLDLTESEYGFFGEILTTADNRPYLKTYALSNIAWNEETRAFYEQHAPQGLEFHNLDTLFGAAMTTGQPVLSNDPATDPRSGGLPEGHPPLDSFLGVPLLKGEHKVGLLGVANRPGGYDEAVLNEIAPLLSTLGNVIEAHRAVRQRTETEKALRESEQALQARFAELEEAHRKLEWQGADLARLAEDLRMARDQAEAGNRAKSEFLAAMSHELRTPLNAIIGFSEIMKNEMLGPVGSVKYRDYAQDIYNSGQHLLDLINDILDLSKVESGMDELHEENIEVREIIRSVIRLLGNRVEREGVELELEVSEHSPMLRADERKLKQILVNLLTNAIKFTEAGGKVTLRAWCRAGSGHEFQIADTGIGIALEDIPKALSKFGQVDSSLARQYEGTGLGLPLTKALVELHGGSLDLRSRVGVGTTVTVCFPKERVVRLRDGTGSSRPEAD